MQNKSNKLFAIIAIIVIVVIVIVAAIVIFVKRRKHYEHFQMGDQILDGAYLNYSSTNAKKNGTFNPSDLAYPQVYYDRNELEDLKNIIRKLIRAPIRSEVIFNSGATESIANCVFWSKHCNKYGKVVGSLFDHSAVEDNCKNQDIQYLQTLNEGSIADGCSMIMLTHVNARTGEIANVPNLKKNVIDKYIVPDKQYQPLVVLDATQSIMKVPIDMERWGLNAVFFSLHKIGGPIGTGVLVIDDDKFHKFKPLIAGKQQLGLRGGSFPLVEYLKNADLFENFDEPHSRRSIWNKTFERFKEHDIKVYEPKGQHLYNTFLIDVEGCPLGFINMLALNNIYVGNISACDNESRNNESRNNENRNEKKIKGGDADETKKPDGHIRISFSDPNELTDKVVDKIIEVLTT